MNKSFRSFVVFEIQTWPTTLAEQMSPRSAGLLKGRPGTGLTSGKVCNLHVYIYILWHSATSLWLVADFANVVSYTTSLIGNIKPSRPRFCQVTAQQGHTTTSGTPCPKLFLVIIQFDLSVQKLTQRTKWAAPTAILYTTVKQNDH